MAGVLYAEPQVFPGRFALIFLAGVNLTALVIVLSDGSSLADGWWLFLVMSAMWAVIFGWIFLVYRSTPVELDPRALQLPWRPLIPLDSITESRVVEGRELRRIRAEITRGSPAVDATVAAGAVGLSFLSLGLGQLALLRRRTDPAVQGLVSTTGVSAGIYVEATDRTGKARRWLIGTRHPQEFGAALDSAIAARKAR